MASYISSNNNRFYAKSETVFGQIPDIDGSNRFPAVELSAHQQLVRSQRRDKTGTRTFLGSSPLSRRATAFSVSTYLTSWNGVNAPGYEPLLQSACGGLVALSSRLIIAAVPDSLHLVTTSPHGLVPGNAISQGAEIRFAVAIIDQVTLVLNAPFSGSLAVGSNLTPCLTFSLGETLPSFSLFDYWDPTDALQRIITGATVDALSISTNGAFQELTFSGLAADLVDSKSFVSGDQGLETFPIEPNLGGFDYSIVAGHLGEAWLGVSPTKFLTLTAASIELKNGLIARNMEFGSAYPLSFAAAERSVSLNFSLFADDSAMLTDIYVAAKQHTPLPVMFQLGQQRGQMMGIYMPALVPEMPIYNDHQPRLIWDFKGSLAQGKKNDELYIALA